MQSVFKMEDRFLSILSQPSVNMLRSWPTPVTPGPVQQSGSVPGPRGPGAACGAAAWRLTPAA